MKNEIKVTKVILFPNAAKVSDIPARVTVAVEFERARLEYALALGSKIATVDIKDDNYNCIGQAYVS